MNLVELSIRRPVTVAMFTVALLVFGFILAGRLGLNLLPELAYPTLTVRTDYDGAAPAEVEHLVTKPVEESLGVIKNLRQIRSISRAGQSDVVLEFNWGTDMGTAGLETREKLDILQLPLDVDRPSLLRFNPSLDPILRLSLATKSESGEIRETSLNDLIYLRRFAEDEVKKRIESIEGVASVKLSGGLEDEIQVLVNQDKLAQLNLPIERVAARLKAENVNLAGGRLEEGVQQYLVRTLNQYQSVTEIGNTIIGLRDGAPLYLRDIATVRQQYKEREAITRINGVEAVEIAIYKEGDANTVTVAERVMKRIDQVNEGLPGELEIVSLYDQSQFIAQAIDEVIQNAIIGGILAMLVLYLFLRNFTATAIISMAIPVSVIASFNLMHVANISMNIMSIGGIALAIGLLVDNAIVVLENIARHQDAGEDPDAAAHHGTREVSMAVTAATLTTIAVFAPLIFVQGIAGQLFKDQALTVTFALIISLLVALTLIPMLSAKFSRRKLARANAAAQPAGDKKVKTGWTVHAGSWLTLPFVLIWTGLSRLGYYAFKPVTYVFNLAYDGLARVYNGLLAVALRNRLIVLLVAVGIFSGSLLLIPRIGVELIPQLSQGEFIVEVKASPGTPLARTDQMLSDVQREFREIPAIDRVFSVSGSGNRLDASPDQGGENWGEINLVLKKPVNRSLEDQVLKELRARLSRIPGIEYKISRPTLFTFKTPLEVELAGYNLEKLKTQSRLLIAKMNSEDRFSDIKSTIESGHPEVQIRFDQEKAAHFGLDVPEVANRVVHNLKGEVATRYAFRDRKIDVLVRVEEEDRTAVSDIHKLIINPAQDKPVTLDAVAEIRIGEGPSEIHRLNQQRVAVISANLRYGDLGQAADLMQSLVDDLPFTEGVTVKVSGQNEEMKVSFDSLKLALALAVFLVYLVMASQFESLLHPFVILFTIPLSLVGAILALFVTGYSLSVVVFIGVIMLAGIVVNNAIVLIDRINQLRIGGMDKIRAIREAAGARLRPIMMTTLTTTLGMMPLALGLGEGAEIRAPMAITVIGGLLISTLLTLIVIPVVYSLVDRKA